MDGVEEPLPSASRRLRISVNPAGILMQKDGSMLSAPRTRQGSQAREYETLVENLARSFNQLSEIETSRANLKKCAQELDNQQRMLDVEQRRAEDKRNAAINTMAKYLPQAERDGYFEILRSEHDDSEDQGKDELDGATDVNSSTSGTPEVEGTQQAAQAEKFGYWNRTLDSAIPRQHIFSGGQSDDIITQEGSLKASPPTIDPTMPVRKPQLRHKTARENLRLPKPV
jgi:chromosome segregation ATPase